MDYNEQISDEGNPDLDLDGVGALTIKVFQWEVLLQLLEEQFDLPSPPIDLHDLLRIQTHITGDQGGVAPQKKNKTKTSVEHYAQQTASHIDSKDTTTAHPGCLLFVLRCDSCF